MSADSQNDGQASRSQKLDDHANFKFQTWYTDGARRPASPTTSTYLKDQGHRCHVVSSCAINDKSRTNKKDGYRQQNVRQRQKLISIIDYNVCMTFY